MQNFSREGELLGLEQPYPDDLAWINLMFEFPNWRRGHVGYRKAFPETVGKLRGPDPNHGQWEEQRRRESEFKYKDGDSTVLIVGGWTVGWQG